MHQYLDLLNDILENGESRNDRTGVGTIGVFGRQIRFNLKESFPAVTTKKLAWRAVVSELLWFIEGSGDERRLCEILHGTRDVSKKTIWSPNANAKYWTPKAEYPGDLGRVYGVQWRQWGPRVGEHIDQLRELISKLKTNPTDRRHILTAWNPGELNQMALPPCHIMCQFYVNSKNELSCHMYQRSVDVFLGLPFNIASYALFTHMIAQVCGLKVNELIISTGDTHIYSNHIEQVKEQLARTPLAAPELFINPAITDIDRFTMDDIHLIDYQCMESIKAEMAV
jgi:thymidylate synthase